MSLRYLLLTFERVPLAGVPASLYIEGAFTLQTLTVCSWEFLFLSSLSIFCWTEHLSIMFNRRLLSLRAFSRPIQYEWEDSS